MHAESETNPMGLRVMSYNVYGCIDTRRVVNVARVARVIGESGVDIVALQEVDAESSGDQNRSQARRIAASLGLDHRYLPIEKAGRHTYGLAVLSRFPIGRSEDTLLPNLHSRLSLRKRGAMRVEIQTPHGFVDLINTHWSVFKLERYFQMKALLRWSGLGRQPALAPLVFCGDLNARPSSLVVRTLSRHMTDVQSAVPSQQPQATFPSAVPVFRIDHIFVSHHCEVVRTEVIRNGRTLSASDHLPLVAHLRLRQQVLGATLANKGITAKVPGERS